MATLSISLSLLRNALHAEFHGIVSHLVERFGPDRIGLDPDVVQAYAEVVRKETACVTTTRESAYTEPLHRLDRERTVLLGAILGRVRYARISADPAVRAAAPRLKLEITRSYPCSIKRAGAQVKSAQIGALLADLAKFDPGVLRSLGIDAMCTELERANTAHVQAYLQRHRETCERGLGVMPPLRAEADRLYRRLCVEATYAAGRTDGALQAIADPAARAEAEARRDVARHFVGQLQEHIDYYKAYCLRRRYPSHAAAAEGTAAAAEGTAMAAEAPTAPTATAFAAAAPASVETPTGAAAAEKSPDVSTSAEVAGGAAE